MNKWQNTIKEEQETTINLDYYAKTITLYTSRKIVAQKLRKAIGKPTIIHYTNNLISGVKYTRNIDSKDTKKLLSKNILVGQIKTKKQ